VGEQCYVLVRGILVPQPPWGSQSYDILISIPAAYDGAELDGFYVTLPCTCNGEHHSKVNGPNITVQDRNWQMVSWHYLDGKRWRRGLDTLESHITHCKGFFLARGLKANVYKSPHDGTAVERTSEGVSTVLSARYLPGNRGRWCSWEISD